MLQKKNILVVLNLDSSELESSDLEIISAGQFVADKNEGSIIALVFLDTKISNKESLSENLIARGVDEVDFVSKEYVSEHDLATYIAPVSTAIEEKEVEVVLFTHNNFGNDLAPRIAFRHRAAIITGTECIEVRDSGELLLTRVCFGGRAQQTIQPSSSLVVITVREKIFEPLEKNCERKGKVVDMRVDQQESSLILLEQKREESKGVRLESASVVVAGGRGVGGPEGFEILSELAKCLNGALGASRVACDLGWVPHSWQVGLSGKTVSPNIYFAVGISGASHHLAGCGTSKAIVAINTDKDAPIFSEARFGIVGEFSELIPALVEELKKDVQTS